MSVSYKEYKEKLDEEENMEYNDFPNDLDSWLSPRVLLIISNTSN